jgi:RimJ/RimL family protein N-acetyltransferase
MFMKYHNAAELLPLRLLQELQEYAQGETLYIPKVMRKSWGEGTGARTLYSRRNKDIRKQFSLGVDLSKETWEKYVNANLNSEDRILFAFETHDGEYVGGGNLHGIDERNGTFGMFVSANEERYAIAGAKMLLDYAFNERRLNNCHTGFIENDTIYKPVFEKLGFKLEGVRRQQVFHKGKYWDECLYGMLAEEFNAQK